MNENTSSNLTLAFALCLACFTASYAFCAGGPKAACAGCAGFAAFSVVIEKFLEGHS